MALSVRLSGYNVDADLLARTIDLLRTLKARAELINPSSLMASDAKELYDLIGERLQSDITLEAFTPETLSAAYARISRDPKHVTELRKAARFGVARARKSNESIIFGLGHASVAEHAAFNFDVSGISRLASEELQSHRLVSFTEKSQRYITIGEDFVIPPEAYGSGLEEEFRRLIPELFRGYSEVYEALREKYLSGTTEELSKRDLNLIEGRAKEDARYLLPLACTSQMGMTMNARNVEHVMATMSDHPLQEIRNLGAAIGGAVGGLAPSLVKYTSRGDYPRRNREALRRRWDEREDDKLPTDEIAAGPSSRVVDFTQDGESRLLRALAFSSGKVSWSDYRELNDAEQEEIWRELFEKMTPHDSALREFELLAMTFEAEVSACCFAQLKRHRMMTLLAQDYCIDGGAILPPAVGDAGLQEKFAFAVAESQKSARQIAERFPLLAPYLLTNAQRRRVLMQVNARELYHFARLRSDKHAQWEIRELSDQMIESALQIWPKALMLACGKDEFSEKYEALFPETAGVD